MALYQVATGQQYLMRHYTMQDGLSNSLVYRIFQDKRGFMWFCTTNGLSSFNGKSFQNYFTKDGLTSDCIMSMSEDSVGNKIISTLNGGLCIMSDNSFFRDTTIKNYSIKNILYAVSKNNILWLIANMGGQYLYKMENNKISEVMLKENSGNRVVYNKLISYEDKILFAATNGIYEITDTIVKPFLQKIIHEKVIDVKRSKNGDYWIGMENKIIQVKDERVVKTYNLNHKQKITTILTDRNNNVWIAFAGSGVCLIKDDRLIDITNRLAMPKTIINDLYEDKEGDIWIATYNAGVYKIKTLDILSYANKSNNIYAKAISPINDNDLLVGTIGYVYRWHNNTILPYNFNFLNPDEYIYTVNYCTPYIFICSPFMLYKIKNGNTSKRVMSLTKIKIGATSFCVDSKKRIWIGGYSNLYWLNNNNLIIDTESNILSGKRYNVIFEDYDKNIWFGTNSGLIVFDGKKYSQQILPGSHQTNIIYAILEDSYKRMWFATKDGLICKDKEGFRMFTTDNGLIHNQCNAIIEDNNNVLWIGTLNGLNYIDLKSLEIKPYCIGLYPAEILSLYSKDSFSLFVGTTDGISIIQTKNINIDDNPPPTYITAVKTVTSYVRMPKRIELTNIENRITIDFIGVSYRYPDMVEYRYKIRDLDKDWRITKNNSIDLRALPFGDYTFVLSARQNRGRWGKDVTLDIHVPTPFWAELWFIIMTFFASAITMFIIIRWRVKKYEAKKRSQLLLYNKIIYLKQQALSALVNPHFIFNCMNSIQHYLNNHDIDMANNYLADFASLIRMTIENAQDSFIKLGKEIERIKLYLSLECIRFGEYLQYEIVVDPELEIYSTKIPNMILQPYIENAILHGIIPKEVPGFISVIVHKSKENEITISIKDDGVGLNWNRHEKNTIPHHQPLGIKLTDERLTLLKMLLGQYYSVNIKEITDENNIACGTLVEIKMPLVPKEQELNQMQEDL